MLTMQIGIRLAVRGLLGATVLGAVAALGVSAASAAPASVPVPTSTTLTVTHPADSVLAIPSSTVVGLSWTGRAEAGTRVLLRVRESGTWGSWQRLPIAASTSKRTVIEPLMTRAATAVRVRVVTPSGISPTGVRLVAIASPASALDNGTTSSAGFTRTAVSAPAIITRAQWGADETRRSGTIRYTTTLKAGVLHHTTGWSTYTQAEAYQFIRALYDWYTTPVASGGPGYGDMAYNLLVDRYGRVFEGAAGGASKAVIARHTIGFDSQTVGVAAMGDFSINPVPADGVMVNSLAAVMAWRLESVGAVPSATTTLVATAGGGNSRYTAGSSATVPVISPASALAVTASPGTSLAARLPEIRWRATSLMGLPQPAPAIKASSSITPSALSSSAGGVKIGTVTNRPMAWKATITSPCRPGNVRVLTGTQTVPGDLALAWNLRDSLGVAVTPGAFAVTVTGTAVDGGQAAAPLSTTVRVLTGAGANPGPCRSVPRIHGGSAAATSILIGRWSQPAATSAILVPGATALDTAYQQVAAPLARARRIPVLVTGVSAVSAPVMADLKARGVKAVLIVAPPARVASTVVSQLAAAGITTWRASGTDLPTVAASVAKALGAAGSRGAIFVDPVLHPSESALAAGAAARRGMPLLILAGGKVPTATAAVVKARGITRGTVVAPASAAPASVLTALGSSRIWASDYVTLGLILAPSVAATGDRAILVPVRTLTEASLSASTGRPLLPVSGAPSAAVTAWLDQREQITDVGATVRATVTPDTVLVSMARWLDERETSTFTVAGVGSRGAAVAAEPVPAPIPGTFALQGSGWGHGVGLSQAGAYGQAKEGRTAEQIVTHYYTGTEALPVDDAKAIIIALQHRVKSVSLRSEAMQSGASAPIRVALAYGATIIGTKADRFTFRLASGRVVVSRTTAGVTTVVGTAPWVRVTWAGTRFSKGLGSRPTLINLVGPGDSFSGKQHRYRFGLIDIRPIAASSSGSAGLMVLNSVRVHDEYLYGLAEVNASWPIEALRAQILASRSYALARVNSGLRKGCLCHSDDGGGPYYDQTFLGWVKVDEGPYSAAWRAAVDSTAVGTTQGLAVTYQGQPFAAYYTDSTGGRTRNVEDVWGGEATPWARGVDDHWSLDPANSPSFAQWRPRLRAQADMAALFGLPDVVAVTVTARQSSGTALELEATSSTGETSRVTGRQFGRAMKIPSLWVWSVDAVAPV